MSVLCVILDLVEVIFGIIHVMGCFLEPLEIVLLIVNWLEHIYLRSSAKMSDRL